MKIAQFITRRRHHPVVRQAVHWARRVIDAADNSGNGDMAANGEIHVLNAIGHLAPACIFDVGCNRGDWAAAAAMHCPSARIHGFEAVPSTARHCSERFKDDPRVRINAHGLSDTDTTIELRVWSHDDRLSSAVFDAHAGESTLVPCRMMRGDDYADGQGIGSIDLLKIDVEGAEPAVLRGFSRLMARGAVRAIQFEYGRANLHSRFYLSDYHALLGGEYAIGRIFPDGVEFRPYDPRDERFELANFLAVRRDQPALLAAVASATGPRPG